MLNTTACFYIVFLFYSALIIDVFPFLSLIDTPVQQSELRPSAASSTPGTISAHPSSSSTSGVSVVSTSPVPRRSSRPVRRTPNLGWFRRKLKLEYNEI